MTKEDKVFLTSLIKGLEGRFDGFGEQMNARFDEHDGRFDGLEGRMGGLEGRMGGLEGRFDGLEGRVEENSKGIRYNGMMLEQMRDDIMLIRERDSIWDEMNAKIDATLESTGIDIPALKHTVSSHSKRINASEAKYG